MPIIVLINYYNYLEIQFCTRLINPKIMPTLNRPAVWKMKCVIYSGSRVKHFYNLHN